MTKILFLTDPSEFQTIPKHIFKSKNVNIVSLNYEVHRKLESLEIKHIIGDNLLNRNERFEIFDNVCGIKECYYNISDINLHFNGVNLLKILDSNEFHTYLMSIVCNLIIIKKIVEKEQPVEIIATKKISKLLEIISKKYHINIKIFDEQIEDNLLWNKIEFKFNLGKNPFSIRISRRKYIFIKNVYEKISNLFNNFWVKEEDFGKKSLVFLEFNPILFSNLLKEMSDYDGNIILVNLRRSAIWNKSSQDIIKKFNCKILDFEHILNKNDKKRISDILNTYSKNIETFFQKSNDCEKIFKIMGISFWDAVSELLQTTYLDRLKFYLKAILATDKTLKEIDIRCIISLNESGETEKLFLESNKKKYPTILLEHGFTERLENTKRFDNLGNYDKFNDKIAVWGKSKKEYLEKEYGIKSSNIFVTGSPRHDDYFSCKIDFSKKYKKRILLAPNPVNDINGISDTNLKIQVNEIIEQILKIINNFDDIEIFVKLHPIQLKHNEEITSFIKSINSEIPIYLWTPVIKTINKSDIVIVLSPEIHATSTILIESMILQKPVMNIYFDKEIPKFDYIKNNAVFAVSSFDNISNNLKKILFDDEFQTSLKENANRFIKQFMSNPNTASKEFSLLLKSY